MNPRLRRFHGSPLWGYFAFSLVVTFVVYGPALRFPSVTDDIYLLRAINSLNIPDLFTHTKSVPWYRPMGRVPWEILETLTGQYSPVGMHLVNIVTHAMNGVLVALLSRRIHRDQPVVPWLTMAFFLLFPLSAEAVTWSAANGHLFIATGALVAIYALDLWLDSMKPYLLVVIWIGVFAGIFSHENGVIIPVLMGMWLVYRKRPITARSLLLVLVPPLVIVGVYLLIWLLMPRPVAPLKPLDGFFYSLVYFYQGLTVPFSQFGGTFSELLGVHGDLAALVLVVCGLLVLYWGSRGAFRLGFAWYSLAILVPAIFLDAHQNVESPRYMVLASVGAALTWTVLVNNLYRRFTAVYRVIPLLLAPVTLGGGAWFIHNYLALYAQMESLYSVVYETAQAGDDAVFFNLPRWFGYDRSRFGIGREGIKYLYYAIDLSEFAYFNTQHRQELRTRRYTSITPVVPGRSWGLVGREYSVPDMANDISELGRGFATKMVGDYWGWESIVAIPETSFDDAAVFENGTRLIASVPRIISRGVVAIELAWQIEQPPEGIEVFLHLACNEQTITAQADGSPLRGLYPFFLWSPGARWQEARLLQIGENAPEACFLRVGLYDPVSGVRIPLQDGREFLVVHFEAAR